MLNGYTTIIFVPFIEDTVFFRSFMYVDVSMHNPGKSIAIAVVNKYA